jgi:hypothetical protein
MVTRRFLWAQIDGPPSRYAVASLLCGAEEKERRYHQRHRPKYPRSKLIHQA